MFLLRKKYLNYFSLLFFFGHHVGTTIIYLAENRIPGKSQTENIIKLDKYQENTIARQLATKARAAAARSLL